MQSTVLSRRRICTYVVHVMHQSKLGLASIGTGDHFNAYRAGPVAVPSAAPAEELRDGFRGIKYDYGHNSEKLGRHDVALPFGPDIPVTQRLLDGRPVKVPNDGELQKLLHLVTITAFSRRQEVEAGEGGHEAENHDRGVANHDCIEGGKTSEGGVDDKSQFVPRTETMDYLYPASQSSNACCADKIACNG